jgi:hypothetical protein
MNAIAADLEQETSAAGSQDVQGLRAACDSLLTDVGYFQTTALPAPDSQLDANLSLAMATYLKSASACIAGDYVTTAADMSIGTPYITAATARMKVLNGS